MDFKKIFKYVCTAVAVIVLLHSLVGCGAAPEARDNTIVVGASASPHAEILNVVKDKLKEEGYELEIKEFSDYVQPNAALAAGELDANYFQHLPYLVDYNTKNDTDLISVGGIHFEPLAIFAGKSKDLHHIAQGATIAVPSDPTNEARALLLLQDNGIIELKKDAGLEATSKDIEKNPYDINIIEAEAASLPRKLEDVDFAVINGNYALSAGLSKKDVLATEDTEGLIAKKYANIIAVRAEDKDSDKTQALVSALQSADVADFITGKYQGQVVAVF